MDTLFNRVGGEQFFFDLVDRFYLGVAGDPVLRPLYPDDLTESTRHLALFLVQYWGGPSTYSDERGHPRLRMRHAPFVIGPLERDAWLRHMEGALGSLEEAARISPGDATELREYLEMAANSLLNAG
ncbi:MAG TPA: globin [Acidimicrobiales bacterium]|nr:globin [Acidimicrobiales bacterium]